MNLVDEKALDPRVVERLSYLREMLVLYTEHTNNMMSFFLVGAGLAANAYVQAFNPEFHMGMPGRLGLAAMGVALSLIFLGIHFRSSQLLHAVENRMKLVEPLIFPAGEGFLLTQPGGPLRMRWLFPAAYIVFAATFTIMLVVAYRAG